MNKEEFGRLLLRYQRGECTEQEARLIHEWYDQLAHDSQEALSLEEKDQAEQRIWSAIRHRAVEEAAPIVRQQPLGREYSFGFYARLAASIAAISLLAALYFSRGYFTSPVKETAYLPSGSNVRHLTNSGAYPQTLVLDDKSIVTLMPGGSLTYPNVFAASQREVHLTGNAFFKITKNARKPFRVYSSKLVTQVLGTSFWVKNEVKQNRIEVAVVTGKVAVYEQQQAARKRVTLTPNQQVSYSAEAPWLQTGLVRNPIPIDSSVTIAFNDVPLTAVLKRLEKRYGIALTARNRNMQYCTFTGDITDLTMDEQLNIICQSVNASYVRKGTRILISGSGCHP
ncbi:FecR family protein [Spirosoma oryzicola]|uniref:FecR family protein n=1 Tax=Spirosoma oryzicola TaxID=2898794 RepID=UPI001E5A233B|nr:FecR family protein [Spirosoma oryzicola]UHG93926.1 FecR family protein [Spirosoma oryzicola]